MKVLILCAAVLCIAACKKTGSEGNNDPGTFPDKVGDSWVYLVNDTTRENGLITSIDNYNMTVSVVKNIVLPGGVNANVWVYSTPAGSDTCYVVKTTDTLHFTNVHGNGRQILERQYIIPVTLNTSWPYTNSFMNVNVDAQADITVGSKLFKNAEHIYGSSGMPDAVFRVEEWFENKVGTVKRYIDPYGEMLTTKHYVSWSLVSYHLQ